MLLGLTVKAPQSPLRKIRSDGLDHPTRIIDIDGPDAGEMSSGLAQSIRHRDYVARGFTPPAGNTQSVKKCQITALSPQIQHFVVFEPTG